MTEPPPASDLQTALHWAALIVLALLLRMMGGRNDETTSH